MILAAGAVYVTHSACPDLVVAFAMALLFLHSAFLIIRQARTELRTTTSVASTAAHDPARAGFPD